MQRKTPARCRRYEIKRAASAGLQEAEEGAKGVAGQLGGVEGGRGQSAQSLGDRTGVERAQISHRLAMHPFGKPGTGGDGGHAALGFETRLEDTPMFDARGQTQHVATGGVAHLDPRGGQGQVASIAGVLEMIQERRVVGRFHSDSDLSD